MWKRNLLLLLAGTGVVWLALGVSGSAQMHGPGTATTSSPAEPEDPFKSSSELNHHIAGYGLIAIGLLALAGHSSPRAQWLQLAWPALFVVAGLFLVVWSDPEIWPRGDHGWIWMLLHGPDARQHKIFAFLMIVLGAVEYLRTHGRLNRFWQVWAFPMLAVFGAVLLLFHSHKVSAVVRPDSPPQHQHAAMDPTMHHEDHGASQEHPMTATMVRVERQHFWFAVVGATVALFKFLWDGRFWRRGFLFYFWPGSIALLGVLLVLYRE